METVYVVDALRTPIGSFGGALASIRPDDLLALIIESIIKSNGKIDVNEIEDVIAGDANQAGEDNRNVARWLPCWPAYRFLLLEILLTGLCASGLQAIMDASGLSCAEMEICLLPGALKV